MHQAKRRLTRGALMGSAAATVAVLATGLVPVAAQVIGDPLGLVSIGTSSSDNPSASALAVSNGGNASGGTNGAGITTGSGNASGGLVAVSGTGCANTGNTYANAPVAVSGTGCAGGTGTTISGTGPACGTGLVAVSVTGASCAFVAVSATGSPSGTYSADGYGNVTAEGQVLSVWTGALLGGPQEPDQLQDPTYTTTYMIEPDAMVAKEEAAQLLEPAVDFNLANCAAGCLTMATASTATQCPPGGCVPTTKDLPWSGTYQQTQSTCGPSSSVQVLRNLYGETISEYGMADKESGHHGTSFGNIPPAMNDLFKHHYYPQDFPNNPHAHKGYFSDDNVRGDPSHLMTYLTEDVVYGPFAQGGNAVVFDVMPTDFPWWQGVSSPDGHYVDGTGYDHRNGGQVHIWDEYDISKFYSHYPRNPYGAHWTSLANVEASMNHGKPGKSPFGNMIW